jgi:DNA-binding transcriptional ArsR family regulator
MSAKSPDSEAQLVEHAVLWLRQRLPDSWEIESSRPDFVQIRAHNVYGTLAIVPRSSFTPRDVERLLGTAGRSLREFNPNLKILVVAPWLSPRAQELLSAEGFNYLDVTGNALIQLESPAVFVSAKGASSSPRARLRGAAGLRGSKAGRLVRFLVDSPPPYGVSEIAEATGLTPGYVSRLLTALDEQALIARAPRGRVTSVDIRPLIEYWSDAYDIFTANDARTFVARRGALDTLPLLAGLTPRAAITGSFAAVRVAPIAAPALLCIYTDEIDDIAGALDLMPADQGANVALLRPYDSVVWDRTIDQDGVTFVAPSQIAVDCLTGNGRMPAEGEAVLEWMVANESVWRTNLLEAAEL